MNTGVWTAIGAGVGVAFGAALGNLPLWIAAGAAVGVVLGAVVNRGR